MDGLTALHHAALSGFEDIVERLLKAGSDVNAYSKTFGTPLCLAALKRRSNVVSLLLANRAKADHDGAGLGSPLHAACCSGDIAIVKALHAHGASLRVSAMISDDALRRLMALDRPFGDATFDLVAMAVVYEHFVVARYLVKNGADLDCCYPLCGGSGEKDSGRPEADEPADALRALQDTQSDQDRSQLAREEWTALMFTSSNGLAECAEELVKAGARLDTLSATTETALWFAIGRNNSKVVLSCWLTDLTGLVFRSVAKRYLI